LARCRYTARAWAAPASLELVRVRVVMVAAMVVLAGCGGGGSRQQHRNAPVLGQTGNQPAPGPPLGYPVVATKNTTRVAGGDPVADAAAVARAVFPELKPKAVTLVDSHAWQAGVSAAELAGGALRAPILLTDGSTLPSATKSALAALAPTGAAKVGGAQVLRVGTQAAAGSLRTTDVAGASPAALANNIDALAVKAAGKPSATVVVAAPDRSAYAMPAAGWAAKAGAPVLWTAGNSLPGPTVAAIRRHHRPRIFVLGPANVVSDAVLSKLRKLGPVTRVAGKDPVTTAIAFARQATGWNVRDPGHGLVFASTKRPLDAAAGAPLSASGSYGPLLLITDATALPGAVQNYLLDIEPGYDTDPVRGVYNHGWLLGDESAIALPVQARIDTLLEIQPVQSKGD
jgi:ell wall binding domain 2 (CWB2)